MITRGTLADWIGRQPFEPFELQLSNGESYQVRHPECAALTRTELLLTRPDSHRVLTVGILHIVSIEHIELATDAGNQT